MHHIIVPVDLSENSRDALVYAANLAHEAGIGLTMIHGYSLLEKAANLTGISRKEEHAEEWMHRQAEALRALLPDVPIQVRIVQGDVIDFLRPLVDETRADFVVMGCQGRHESEDTYLGSTAGAMVKTTDIPVLFIPPRYKYQRIDRVVFTVKNTTVRYLGTLEPVLAIKELFKPHIQLLHIGENPDPVPEQSFSILQVIHDITRYGNDNFNESINEYLSQHRADLVIAIRRKRGFLERTLGPTKTFADKFHVNVPMLVLVGEDY